MSNELHRDSPTLRTRIKNTISGWMKPRPTSSSSDVMAHSKLVRLPQLTPPTQKFSAGSKPGTSETNESKQKSTSSDETAVEPGDAPIAIDSPKSVLTKQTTHGEHSPAVVVVEKVGPLLIFLTFTCGILVCAVVLILVFGPSHLESKTQAAVSYAVAQAETRIRTEVAEDVAEAKAVAHTAETHGRVALDRVMTAEVELGKKGINIRTDGH